MLRQNHDEVGTVHLTAQNIQWLKDEIRRLEQVDRPKIVEALSHALSLGDFSENAEYQDAKHQLSRIDGRIFSLSERLKRAVEIPSGPNATGAVQLGSTVTVRIDGNVRTYQIVGPHESSPTHGRISHVSPLGSALVGRATGERVVIKTERGEATYDIVRVE